MAATLILGALLAAIPVLIMHALPVLNRTSIDPFSRSPVLIMHVATGIPTLILGALALWTRPAGTRSPRHRWAGRAYLLTGTINTGAGLAISVIAPHQPHSLYVATGASAVAWLLASAMAFRAIINRQVTVHREWMLRSYVLTWTFVGCRLAQEVTVYPALGVEGVTAAVWLNWVVPLFIMQVLMDWRRGGRQVM